ncbi:hypothetical protein [Algoriphagus pacificus]|uniref:Uncharacterized protein n=1 Tax=Algoriphagus pacificus TaxID=2811234 RepID=A0ABS3CD93_9BACT|nr:hypothetical protein [Algoriphagus pacificus]MBN7814785.1 hypothetical protein [Algoriphagus pacificus]
MKIFTTKMLGLVISALLLGACSQMATYENEDLTNGLEKADQPGFKLSPFGSKGFENAVLSDCNDCITEPQIATGIISKTTGQGTTNYGEYSVYNTPDKIVLTFNMFGTVGADFMSVEINGSIYTWSKDLAKDPAFTNVTTAVNGKILSFEIEQMLDVKTACTEYEIEVSYEGGPGGSLSSSSSYAIYEYCSEECDEESFSYVATVAGTDMVNVIFTYDAAEALEDAVVKFTFPQIQDASVDGIYTGPDGKKYSVNNNGNNTVFTWVGDIGCTNLTGETFEFEVTADCNSSDKAQIWTSASVNDIVVKNEDTPNIRFYCSTQEIEETNED